ncbi:aromatic amino acid DMT transporter YddG [Rhodococcus rhodochrous]|uniref:aromatic amino acid DMT transporter YddG n=1 Tax=Rhodococcus rhodochrous TaxID=1829 RepID=UPI001576AD77|nr:aromatic amino acid DMT transporter YddG [Rhodococcus rhodochrous]
MAGLAAIVLWSSMVGMIRLVTESLGAIGGAAMIYSCCAILLSVTVGWPTFANFSRTYLATGAVMFAAYEVCFALAIGFADTPRQAIEVGIVNYLWPSLTVVFAIVFTGQKASRLIVPGMALSVVGVAVVLGGDSGLDITGTIDNVRSNPLSYALAFTGAVIWAGYCTVTKLFANGNNAITPFFVLTAASFWGLYLLTGSEPMDLSFAALAATLVAACAIGFGYALWNVGILGGNLAFLAASSYFTPVLSAAFSSVLLTTALGPMFWIGTAVVCVGAILCWLATRNTQIATAATDTGDLQVTSSESGRTRELHKPGRR